jgi:3-oxoadipate enol-lactonase
MAESKLLWSRSVGSGVPLVLLRGLGRSSRYWLGFSEQLADLGLQVIEVDNPGFGRSAKLPMPLSVDGIAEAVIDAIAPYQLERPIIAGISLGGMIAAAVAAAPSVNAAGLIMMASSSRESGWRRVRLGSLFASARVTLARRDRHRALAPYLVTDATLAAQPDLLATWDKMVVAEPPTLWAATHQITAGARFRITDYLDRLPTPRLVVVGDSDRMVPPSNSLKLASLLEAEFHLIRDAGHEIATDQPEELAQLIAQFSHDVPRKSSSR